VAKPEQIFTKDDGKHWLPDDAVVWRYVPLRVLFFYLDGLVFIPSIAKLQANDPFEGRFHDDIAWFNSAFANRYGDKANQIDEWMRNELFDDFERDFIEINKNNQAGSPAPQYLRQHYFNFIYRTRFAWCWFHSHRESAAMWSVYGNQGVAIKTDIGKINTVLEKAGRDFIYGKMTYIDFNDRFDFDPSANDLHVRLLLRPFFLKRKEYESENEVRFVTAAAEREERGGILLKNLPPRDWISAIRLWPGLTNDEEKSLCKTIRKMMPDVDCQRSNLFVGPTGDLADTFQDMFEKSADESWKLDEDGIPGPLKQV
jgi:hypothetical protein